VSCWGDSASSSGVTTALSTKVGVGMYHACALGEDQQVRCWGDDPYGYGFISDTPSGSFSDLQVGGYFACAKTLEGAIQCWGNNADGEASPPAEIFGRVEQFALGNNAGCALLTDGSLQCWGGRRSDSVALYGEHKPPLGNDFVAIRHGVFHFCAIRSDGTAACWGDNYAGQTSQVPLEPVIDVGAGWGFSCVLFEDDEVECWGENSEGQTEGP
jgi:alpha-tubulin suppressor-like RCC1 family protein